jgi:hypothetical protein
LTPYSPVVFAGIVPQVLWLCQSRKISEVEMYKSKRTSNKSRQDPSL